MSRMSLQADAITGVPAQALKLPGFRNFSDRLRARWFEK